VSPHLNVLNVEDNPHDTELLGSILAAEWPECDLVRVETEEDYARVLLSRRFDLILSDFSMPGFDGLAALALARRHCADTPFLFVSGTLGEDTAVEAMKSGATDYVLKHRLNRLIPAVRRALDEAEERTRRRVAEETLHRREEYFRALIENASDLVTILNPQGDILYQSPSVERLLGYGPEMLIRKNLLAWVHSEDAPVVSASLRQLAERPGGVASFEYRFRHCDGAWRALEAIAKNLLSHPGVAGLVVNSRDVTERKLAEEHVREQALLLAGAQDAILTCDLTGRIRYWNPGAERLYGWSAEEARGRNVRELLFLQPPPVVLDEAEAILTAKSAWLGELHQRTRAGQLVIVQSRWTLVRDAHGKPKARLLINTDITERKHLEAQILRTQRLETIGALASGVAHDLNNVLAPVLMSVELLRTQVTDPATLQLLDNLEASASRGTALVRQILAFARGQGDEKLLVHLKQLVDELRKILKHTFPPNIQVQTQFPRDLWYVQAHPTQLDQVLLNLCVNARDAMPAGGLLQLAARNLTLDEAYCRMQPQARPGPYVVVTVSDTGSGIPPEVLGNIFDPFFTTKEQGKGTGLGLATVQRIVKNHGGFVTVSSQLGRGTEFKVFLPAVPGEAPRRGPAEQPPLPLGHGELILVVDDESSVREIAKATFEACHYNVIVAKDGTEALAQFARRPFEVHAVITDLQMPYMDGPATIRALRRIEPNLPVIIASGSPEQLETLQRAGLEVQALLTKPFTAQALLRQLQNVLLHR
jgi:hypothetical protein